MQEFHYGSQLDFEELNVRVLALSFYRGVLDDEVGEEVRALIEQLSGTYPNDSDQEDIIDTFGHLTRLLLEEAMGYDGDPVGDLWQNHLLDRMLRDTNLFSWAAERQVESKLGGAMLRKLQVELDTLRSLFDLSMERMQEAILKACPETEDTLAKVWSAWEPFEPMQAPGAQGQAVGRMKRLLARSGQWSSLIGELARYYGQSGTGIFARFRAFRWVVRDGAGMLEGVAAPDPIRLDQLVGYERERQVVLRNTRHFVHGAPANNVLLYGDAGTGKSSLVKALLNEFGDEGLRLVEVAKEHLIDFPYIAQLLRNRRERFILFVDDLSFEEQETEYKGLKALLEGSLDARPENVLVYATSNRRHLVKEYFGDRTVPGQEDVHPHETVQEKLSLSERFGVRVGFLTPDLESYMAIVSTLARQEGISLPDDELRRRAFQWAQWQNGFSGRTARQFINDLMGEMAEIEGEEEEGKRGQRNRGTEGSRNR